MDDFERGAREMQRVAAHAIDTMVAQAEVALSATSVGIDHGFTASRLRELISHYKEAARTIRAISIEGAINTVVGDER